MRSLTTTAYELRPCERAGSDARSRLARSSDGAAGAAAKPSCSIPPWTRRPLPQGPPLPPRIDGFRPARNPRPYPRGAAWQGSPWGAHAHTRLARARAARRASESANAPRARAPDGRVEAVRPRARVHPSPPSLRGGRPSLGRPARWRNPSMSRSTLARAAAASFAVHGAMGWRAPPAIFRSRVISFMLRTSDAMSRTLAAPGASRLKSASRCSTSSTIPSRHSVSVNASPQSTVPLAPHGCRGSFRPLLAR